MFIKVKPDPRREASLQQFHEDGVWFRTHRKELVDKYPDHWIAVYSKEVVGAAEDIEDLMTQVKASHAPPGRSYVKFAATKPKIWII